MSSSYLTQKKLIIFDLDKTLTESKTTMEREMSDLLTALLAEKQVAVISGGSFAQFQKQFLHTLQGASLPSLSLFPTCGAALYRQIKGKWENLYTETISPEERARIFQAFEHLFTDAGFARPERVYGEMIEDRGTQVTFSFYGSQAPLHLKSPWDPDRKKRLRMIEVLERLLPQLEIRTGGASSIDVTRKGIDKAYGIMQMERHLGIPRSEMVFVGDSLGIGGNDHPVIATGVLTIEVSGPEDTKQIIRSIIEAR